MSFVTLEGKYQISDRFVAFGGTATADDKEDSGGDFEVIILSLKYQ